MLFFGMEVFADGDGVEAIVADFAIQADGALVAGSGFDVEAIGVLHHDALSQPDGGGADASAKRLALLKRLNLPEHMSANAMLQALNLLYSLEELKELMENL